MRVELNFNFLLQKLFQLDVSILLDVALIDEIVYKKLLGSFSV